MIRQLLLLFTALILFLSSCSSGLYSRGKKELDAGNYKGAIELFKEAVEKKPESASLWRGLGMAYYRDSLYNEAINSLKQADLLAPNDGLTILYLGLSHERLGESVAAADLYRVYLTKYPNEKISDKIRQRIKYLTDQVVKSAVSQIISSEKSLKTEKIPDSTIAIIGFNPGNLNPRYAPLARGLTELLAIDLSRVGGLKVVERVMLKAILDELSISQSEYFDKSKAPRVGRLLGAAKIVAGQLSQEEKNNLKLESGIIGVKDGFVEYPDNVQGDLNKFFELEKNLAFNIFKTLGYKLTPENENKLRELPTGSFLAFLSYSLGLEYVDQGMYSLAEAQFDNALREDPLFALAREARLEAKGLENYTGEVESSGELEKDIQTSVSSGSAQTEAGADLKTLQQTMGFQPEMGGDESDNPYTTPVVGTGHVTVIGSFDE